LRYITSLKEFDILIKVSYPVIFTGVRERLAFKLIPVGPTLVLDVIRHRKGLGRAGYFAKLSS
jgi:hypothetical protein